MSEVFFAEWIYPARVVVENEVVLRVEFSKVDFLMKKSDKEKLSSFSKKLKRDLEKYFSGRKVDFSKYDVEIEGKFKKRVLEAVRSIDYGKVITYGELAKELGTSPRAVGQALKANPTPVIIPCHRVVAKNSLGGFSQGIEIKRKLLELEGLRHLL